MLGHFARLGGALISPRETLRGALWRDEGVLWEILPWMMVVTAAVAPTRAGRALLVGRTDLLDGLMLFFNLVANRMLGPMLGLLVAALLLHLVSRASSGPVVSFDVALDATAFTLVPFLALAATGSLLFAFGYEVWFLPHRKLTTPGLVGAIRIAVAFAWPVALYAFLLREVWTRPPAPEAESAA